MFSQSLGYVSVLSFLLVKILKKKLIDINLSFDIQKKYNGIELSVFLRLNNQLMLF